MTMSKTFFAAALIIFPSLAASTAAAQFGFHVEHHDHAIKDSYGHVEDLAQRLEFLLNDLCLDLYYNYSHNPGFQETYSEAYALLETAKYIHAADHANDRDAISRKLGGVDALCYHVEGDVLGWSRVHRRHIGTLGILSKMEMTESVLHHLMEDVGVQPEIPEQAPAPGVGGPELAPQPSTFGPR